MGKDQVFAMNRTEYHNQDLKNISDKELSDLLKEIPIHIIMDNMQGGFGLIEMGNDFKVLYLNQCFFDMVGYTAGEYQSMPVEERVKLVSVKDDRSILEGIRKSVIDGELVDLAYSIHSKNNGIRRHHLKGVPMQCTTYQNPIFIMMVTDITEQESTRLSLERQYKKAQRMYKREMRYMESMSQAILSSLKANLTKGMVEFHRTSIGGEYSDQEKESYEESLRRIAEKISDEEERKAFLMCFNREKLLTLFEAGEREAEIEYRHTTGQNEFLWMRTYMKLLRDPESNDVIGVAYTRNAENEKNRMTTSRMLLNQLHVATDQLYAYVMALDFSNYTYDVIQEDHKHSVNFPLHGDIRELTEILYQEYHPDSYDFLDVIGSYPNMMARFVSRNELIYEALVLRGGKEIWYEHKIIPVARENSGQPYYLVMTLDITANKMAEANLKKALQEAKAAGKAKQDFLSHMSHEMRTPLNGIKGLLDIMHQRPELEHDKMLSDAIMSVNHLTGLINDVLDMAKIESGKIELRRNIVSFMEMKDYLDAIIGSMAEQKNITYTYYQDIEQNIHVYSDAGRIKQILTNLLTNAIKYTQPGGQVAYRCGYRHIDTSRVRIHMIVEDSGIGMSREYLEKIYVPFERDEPAKALYNGTGLGLSIVKSLVDLMDGRIEIESEPGKGTKITITLDADVVDEASEHFVRYQHCLAETGFEEKCLQGKHALLVEDNIVNMEIAEYNIRSMGLTCDKAYDGEEALKMYLEAPSCSYDIIFTDIMMPKKDGLTLARDIRSSGCKDAVTVPIVAMTANAFTEDIDKSMESGMNYHLSKPFDVKDIRGILVKEFSNS